MKQLLLIATILLTSTAVSTADPTDATPAAKLPLARRLYEEGVDAGGKGRWNIAFDRFKSSYELAPRAQTLFNLAYAQGQTGRLVEASESYHRFLRETADGRFPDYRTKALGQLELLDRQVAQLILDVTYLDASDVISIDEVEFPHAVLRETIPMNPGPHIARVRRGPKVIAIRTLTLPVGVTESVSIELPAPSVDLELRREPALPTMPAAAAMAAMPASPPVDRNSRRSWLRSPWLWSSVALAVAGGATSAYLLTRPDGVVIH
jgi:hypothetical protein